MVHQPKRCAKERVRLLLLGLAVVDVQDRVVAALRDAGLSDVQARLSIAPVHQVIPHSVLAEIEAFVRLFDRITTREAWQTTVTVDAAEVARVARPETCFFSAWDFHVPPDRPSEWQLVEFNDNGSGFLLAALLNRHHFELGNVAQRGSIEAPASYDSFAAKLLAMIRAEGEAFFGEPLHGPVLILDDRESMQVGRFRQELVLLQRICRAAGWISEIASPSETKWDGKCLFHDDTPIRFVVNRSTDFLWEGEEFSAVRAAYESRSVYVAPNPFTYSTRSDKRLLEWLSTQVRDSEVGILPEERKFLGAHVPETRLLREENVDELVSQRDSLFFKPCHGFASHGLLPGARVGRTRLRRLLKKGHAYVAQRSAPKSRLSTSDGVELWVDLRVWAYRGERFLLSGRASRKPDGLDLSPPGGWLATYAESLPNRDDER
ncbi:hypothetical protein AKJ09_02462 [Labilithrix luteola]|uniref:Glutathionylspermidine synthase pre-ATP-grasp-like domain-containing protein n=1 Tax=Labilithrix luteola TaxID=1391654 RepID=A0A0K1PQK0_9BACT|nr:hypothetical protein AKJ09_02462 [Labilithrix luteola]